MTRQWKTCKKLSKYQVSDDGLIRNKKTGRVLKTAIDHNGREIVCLFDGSKKYTRRVHRLVAETFDDRDRTGLDVIHKDGNKLNNNLTNLIWGTRADSVRQSYSNGRRSHRMKKIRCVETDEIFDSIVECSEVTGINTSTISKCINNPYVSSREGYHFEIIN